MIPWMQATPLAWCDNAQPLHASASSARTCSTPAVGCSFEQAIHHGSSCLNLMVLGTASHGIGYLIYRHITCAGGAKESASWGDMFSSRYAKGVTIGLLLFAFQQFAGINALVYFSTSVFRQVSVLLVPLVPGWRARCWCCCWWARYMVAAPFTISHHRYLPENHCSAAMGMDCCSTAGVALLWPSTPVVHHGSRCPLPAGVMSPLPCTHPIVQDPVLPQHGPFSAHTVQIHTQAQTQVQTSSLIHKHTLQRVRTYHTR